jgi:hypothetical protein
LILPDRERRIEMVDYEDSREEKPESSQLQNSLQKELEKKLGGKRSPGKRSS